MKKKLLGLILLVLLGTVIFFLLGKWHSKNEKTISPTIGTIVEAVYGLGTIKTDAIYNLRIGYTGILSEVFVSEGDFVQKNAPLCRLSTGFTAYAPFAGIITKIYTKQNEMVTPNQLILSLMNFTHRYIIVSLDQSSILKIRPKQKAEIFLENHSQKILGEVVSLYPSGSEFLVKLKVHNLPKEALPEMTCDVAIEIDRKENALLLPVSAVRKNKVRVMRNNRIILLTVKTGIVNQEWVEITDNQINKNDKIIISE